jgi:hypothetical protein
MAQRTQKHHLILSPGGDKESVRDVVEPAMAKWLDQEYESGVDPVNSQ